MKTYTFRVNKTFHDQKEDVIRKPKTTFTTNEDERAEELKKLPYVKLIDTRETKQDEFSGLIESHTESKPKKNYAKKAKSKGNNTN